MTDTWLSLGVSEDDERHSVLHEEVTSWLKPSLVTWLFRSVVYRGSIASRPPVDMQAIRSLERLLKFQARGIDASTRADVAANQLLTNFENSGNPWQLIDALLASGHGDPVDLLEMLLESGSAWTVGLRAGKPGLIRRVNEGTHAALDSTIAKRGHAGKRLAAAFDAAYGVNPNPSSAYSLAIKAVEDAAAPVVSPKNAKSTLGTIIRDIRQSSKWTLPQTRTDPQADPRDVLLGMMQMLWAGQHDRHGGVTPPPPPVSQEQAETAVMIAVTLVELFASGKIVKSP